MLVPMHGWRTGRRATRLSGSPKGRYESGDWDWERPFIPRACPHCLGACTPSS